jgi:hypothetical protein
MSAIRVALTAAILSLPSPLAAATTVVKGTDATKQVLRGPIVTPNGAVLQGEVVIEGDTITCVAADCPDPAGATEFTVSDAFIFPGFIDAHNHVAYNVLPKWTPPKLYQNRGQWQASTAYKAFKMPYATLKDQKNLFCEMVRWGEIAALISGITTVQGTAPNQTCFKGLVRTSRIKTNSGWAGATFARTSSTSARENQRSIGRRRNHLWCISRKAWTRPRGRSSTS